MRTVEIVATALMQMSIAGLTQAQGPVPRLGLEIKRAGPRTRPRRPLRGDARCSQRDHRRARSRGGLYYAHLG